MQRVLWVCLQAGQLCRRYWLYPACRLGHVEAWRRGSSCEASVTSLSTQPRSLFYRGLSTSWVLQNTGPTLLDTPHTKSYRLLFDARLHKLKGLRALRIFTQNPLYRTIQQEKASPIWAMRGYMTMSFLIEVGGWGENTPHTSQYWLHCMRAMRGYSSVQRQFLKAYLLSWSSLSYAWVTSRGASGTGGVSGVWAGLLPDVEGAVGTWIDGGVDFESYDFIPVTVAGILASFDLSWLSPLNVSQFPMWSREAETPFYVSQWRLGGTLAAEFYAAVCYLSSTQAATPTLYSVVLHHGWFFN